MLLRLLQVLVEPQAIQHVFEPGLFAIGAVAVLDEHAHHRRGHRHAFLRPKQNARVAGKILVAGDAAELHAKIDARPEASCRRCLWQPTCTAVKPMSLVSSSALIVPPPSKAMLNLRGRPYISRWLRM